MSISIFQIDTNFLLFRVWDFFFLEKAIKQLRSTSSQKFANRQRDTAGKKNWQKSFCSYCCCSSCCLNIFDYRISKQLLSYSASWSVTFNSHPTHYLLIYALEVDTQALPCITSVSTWIRPPTVSLFFGSCSTFPNFQRHKTLTTVKNYILFFWHSMFHSLLLFCSVRSSFLLAAVQKFMVIVASRQDGGN